MTIVFLLKKCPDLVLLKRNEKISRKLFWKKVPSIIFGLWLKCYHSNSSWPFYDGLLFLPNVNVIKAWKITLGCVTGYEYSLILPKSSPVATYLKLLDLAQVLRSVPSIVSGQTPIVLKERRHDWLAHSTSRMDEEFVICRQMEAFPELGRSWD